MEGHREWWQDKEIQPSEPKAEHEKRECEECQVWVKTVDDSL